MLKFWSNDEIQIMNREDFPRFIGEQLGRDVEQVVTGLQEQADYTKAKVGTDLDVYEESLNQLEGYTMAVQDIATEMVDYLNTTDRMNRDKLRKMAEHIIRLTDI